MSKKPTRRRLENFQSVYKNCFKTVGREDDDMYIDEEHVSYWWIEEMKTDEERKGVFDRLKKATEEFEAVAELEKSRLVREKSHKILMATMGKKEVAPSVAAKEITVATRCSPTSIVDITEKFTQEK